MQAGSKRPNTTPKGGGSTFRPSKKSKHVDPDSPDEIVKEMSVGFGLERYWYDSNPFPQLHAILKNQNWETLIPQRFILPRNSKHSEVNLRDAT